MSYALSRLSNITSLLFLLILALGENPDVVFQYKESAAFSNLLFPLLPAVLLTCSPSSGSPFSSFWSSCHHFPSNKPRDDLPNSFPRSGMANLHVYTCVSGMVAHILDYVEGWPWLARLKLRLNLTPFDFILFFLTQALAKIIWHLHPYIKCCLYSLRVSTTVKVRSQDDSPAWLSPRACLSRTKFLAARASQFNSEQYSLDGCKRPPTVLDNVAHLRTV